MIRFLSLSNYVAENERAKINARQREDIAAAKSRVVKFGRLVASLPDNFDKVCNQWSIGSVTVKQAAAACNMAASTFYEKAKIHSNAETDLVFRKTETGKVYFSGLF